MNGTYKTDAYRNEDAGYDIVTVTAQFKLKKGDTVKVYYNGTFYNPAASYYAYFEGHLISQITE